MQKREEVKKNSLFLHPQGRIKRNNYDKDNIPRRLCS